MNKGLKILHVDDDDDIRLIADMAFELVDDLDLKQCASGQEALEFAQTYKVDAILLDVMMPGMDGPSTLKRLREVSGYEDVPVIFMTAKAESSLASELLADGAKAVITKPFDPISLGDEVRSILIDQ